MCSAPAEGRLAPCYFNGGCVLQSPYNMSSLCGMTLMDLENMQLVVVVELSVTFPTDFHLEDK